MSKRPPDPLRRFLLELLIWLPIMFLPWYNFAPFFNALPAALTDLLMGTLHPQVVSSVQSAGRLLDVSTHLPVPEVFSIQLGATRQAEMVVSVNPLVYSYGIPLYTALMLVTPGEEKTKWLQWLIGLLILVAGQLWGIYFDAVKTLLFQTGPNTTQLFSIASWQLNAAALGYQLGSLILPPVLPIAIWVIQSREFIQTLVQIENKRTKHET